MPLIKTNAMKVGDVLKTYPIGTTFKVKNIADETRLKVKVVTSSIYSLKNRGIVEHTAAGEFKLVKPIDDSVEFRSGKDMRDAFYDDGIALFRSPHQVVTKAAFTNIAEKHSTPRYSINNWIGLLIRDGMVVRLERGRYKAGPKHPVNLSRPATVNPNPIATPSAPPAQMDLPIMATTAPVTDTDPNAPLRSTADLLEVVAMQLRTIDLRIPAAPPAPVGLLLTDATSDELTAELRKRLMEKHQR